jgi:2-dehydropantoate 2-reductase
MTPAADGRRTVAVVGLGSIGGVAAGVLAAPGRHDILACTRRPMARLTLEQNHGPVELALPVLTDPAEAKPVDWVLLCTKAYQTAATAPWLAHLCTPATRVAVMQNGIDHVACLASLAHGATIVPVLVYNGERLAPDRVRLRHAGKFDVVVADNETGHAFASLFEGTPLRIVFSDDFLTLAWRKLLINAVANPITALTLQRQAVLRRPDIGDLCKAIRSRGGRAGRWGAARG